MVPQQPTDPSHTGVADEFFVAPSTLTVDELTIRTWRPGDGATLAAVANASYEHLAPWMDWATADDPPEAAEVRVRDFAGQYLSRTDFVLSIWSGDELVGGTGLHPRWGPLDHGIAEIGMWIAGGHANQGLGTRVLRALADWAFSDEWGWQQLLWLCDPANVASSRTAEKAGFRLEAQLRGGLGRHAGAEATRVYGLLASDPRPS